MQFKSTATDVIAAKEEAVYDQWRIKQVVINWETADSFIEGTVILSKCRLLKTGQYEDHPFGIYANIPVGDIGSVAKMVPEVANALQAVQDATEKLGKNQGVL